MLRKALDNGVEWLCLVLMAVLVIDLMLGVFSRYVLFSTFTWYDEIARACFVWVVFLGGAVGVKRGAHFVCEASGRENAVGAVVCRVDPQSQLVVLVCV